ncbi:MAG TPA: hypothetical protein VFE98_07590 [Candidatus Bathyarchaeia archaeon]|nr:hypothetical protein [Candidatus Bathyarchaeia archaeon]
MQVVELKNVHDQIGPAAEFLRTHIKGSLRVKGSQIEIEGVEHYEVKLLLHKFLYHRDLEGYKVHSQVGFIEIVPPRKEEDSEESKGRRPTAPETMPYFFPGHAAQN